MDRRISRRQMLGGAAAAFAMPYVVSSVVRGGNAPSRRLTMGAIGLGGQGMHNLKSFLTFDDVRVLAVCDVDASHLKRAKDTVDAAYGNKDCAAYQDFREVLARGDIDTVLIATPDHWHAILAIEAAKAGKDIYCEKPISLTIAEGRAVADTMKRYNTVYQSGTQRRSIACFRFARGHRPQRHARQAPNPALLLSQRPDVPAAAGPAGARRDSITIRGSAPRRWSLTRSNDVTAVSAGSTTTPAANSPTSARTSPTWPSGPTATSPSVPDAVRRLGRISRKTACSTRPCGSRSPRRTPTASR